MHEYSFESGLRRGSALKRSMALSRREVSFEPEKKKKKSQKKKKKDSQPSSSGSSSVSILTSSRPPTAKSDKKSESSPRRHSPLKSIPASKFYEKPKSLLEKQYEKNLQKFVPVETSDDFQALESGSDILEKPSQDDKIDNKDVSHQVIPNQTSDVIDEPDVNLSDILLDTAKEQEFHVTYFINASDEFMKKAHSLVLASNDVSGARVYYSLVKLAIKALYILINEYSSNLNPILESVIYHKLGIIFLKETRALEKAEHFVNLAISLANKHNLTDLKVISEFLYCEILEQINSQALSSFFFEKQETYKKQGCQNIADLYSLMRSNHLLLGDSSLSLKALGSLSLSKEVHPHVRSLSLLNEASTHLYRGSSSLAKESIRCAEDLILKMSTPPQLKALSHLTRLSECIHNNDTATGKEAVVAVGGFISSQRESGWPDWRDDGSFSLSVPLFADDSRTSLFEVQWLNSDEFVIIFYFLNGMLDMLDRSSFERTKIVFMSCLEIINMQLGQLTVVDSESRNFRVSFLTDKIVKLNFIRYSVIYYKLWIEFLHENNYSGISSIQYFINCFDGDNFTKEEMCYYTLLVPKFLYLAAIYFQYQGNLSSAKYYFLRIRKLLSQSGGVDSAKISSLQKGLGLGCEVLLPKAEASELHFFSTLHLCLIVEHDLLISSKTKSIDAVLKSKILANHSLLGDLLSDLNNFFEKEADTGKTFENSNLMYLSYRVLLLTHCAKDSSNGKILELSEHVSEVERLVSENPSNDFIHTLSSYMLYKYSTTLEKSTEMLRRVVSSMVESDENVRLLGLLVIADEDAKNIFKGSRTFAEVERAIVGARSGFQKRLELASLSTQL